MPEETPYMLEEQVGFILRQASQRHTAIFAERMIAELTPTQFSALVKLHEVVSCSQNHLGRLIAVDAATIKGVIDRLTARGLVEIHANPMDARRRLLILSDAGRAVVLKAIPVAAAITEATLAPLDRSERERLLELLKRLRSEEDDDRDSEPVTRPYPR